MAGGLRLLDLPPWPRLSLLVQCASRPGGKNNEKFQRQNVPKTKIFATICLDDEMSHGLRNEFSATKCPATKRVGAPHLTGFLVCLLSSPSSEATLSFFTSLSSTSLTSELLDLPQRNAAGGVYGALFSIICWTFRAASRLAGPNHLLMKSATIWSNLVVTQGRRGARYIKVTELSLHSGNLPRQA